MWTRNVKNSKVEYNTRLAKDRIIKFRVRWQKNPYNQKYIFDCVDFWRKDLTRKCSYKNTLRGYIFFIKFKKQINFNITRINMCTYWSVFNEF